MIRLYAFIYNNLPSFYIFSLYVMLFLSIYLIAHNLFGISNWAIEFFSIKSKNDVPLNREENSSIFLEELEERQCKCKLCTCPCECHRFDIDLNLKKINAS